MTDQTLTLAQQLIRAPSVSPEDAGCQKIIGDYLKNLGFTTESLPFADVSNLWATRAGPGPMLVFAGHTDVVPTGPVDAWRHPPFEPVTEAGILYGRGAADMKGSLAAMLTATERFLGDHPEPPAGLGFLITSDEEADAVNGTVKVMEELNRRGDIPDYCLVGEPSSNKTLGDVIRIGRRGSLTGLLTIHGRQGHVAYPLEAVNPIHKALPALRDLTATVWDKESEFFPATSMQISNINADTGAHNVIPGDLSLVFNFRYSSESTPEQLQAGTEEILDRYALDYDLDWRLTGKPFLTEKGKLLTAVQAGIQTVCNLTPTLSTAGGTSDGRFIAPMGVEVVELGPINATIHQIDECVSIDELRQLSILYTTIMEELLLK